LADARAAAKQAIQALPGSPVGYYHLAITYTSMMKSTEAIRVLKEGFEKTGRDPDLEKTLQGPQPCTCCSCFLYLDICKCLLQFIFMALRPVETIPYRKYCASGNILFSHLHSIK